MLFMVVSLVNGVSVFVHFPFILMLNLSKHRRMNALLQQAFALRQAQGER
jgi:signal transduction histidine kinase